MASSVAHSLNATTWKNVCLDMEVDAHSIFRSGQHACMFDDFFQSSRTVRIVDLETKKTFKVIKCNLGEYILAFTYPRLVTKKNESDGTATLRVWDLSSSFSETPKIIHAYTRDIQRGAIQGNTLVLISTEGESFAPKYVTILDVDDPKKVSIFKDDEIDPETGLVLYKDWLLYSAVLGCLKMVSLNDPSNFHYIPVGTDLESYVDTITEDNYERLYKENKIGSLVIEDDVCVGSTKRALKVWNLASQTLQKTIERKKEGMLFALQDRFLLESRSKSIQIWDITTGKMLHKEENRVAGNIPHLTFYGNTIFRVSTKSTDKLPWKDIQMDLSPLSDE